MSSQKHWEKDLMEKINVTSVIIHPLKRPRWKDMLQSTVEQVQKNYHYLHCTPFEDIFEKHSGKKSTKCNWRNFASSSASNLRKHLKTQRSKTNVNQLRTHLQRDSGEKIYKWGQFEFVAKYWHKKIQPAFKNIQMRKVQSEWPFILFHKQFEDTFENKSND